MPVNLFEAMRGLQTAIVGFMLAVFLATIWAFNSSIQVVEQTKKPSSPQPPGEEETPFRNDPVLSKLWERTVKRLRSHYAELGINLCGLFGNGTLVVGLPVEATDEDLACVEEGVREIVGDDVPILMVRARFIEDTLTQPPDAKLSCTSAYITLGYTPMHICGRLSPPPSIGFSMINYPR